MASMLHYIGYPPVNEMFVVLVALTSISRSSQLFLGCQSQRWAFFQQLGNWVLLMRITDIVVKPEDYCYISDNYVSGENHSTSATQLLQVG